MSELREHAVNWRDYFRNQLQKGQLDNDSHEARLYTRMFEAFQEVIAYIDETERRLRPLPKELGDLSDLPAELVDELNVARIDELESQLIDVIRAYDGKADLDQILVGLFRKFKVVQQRRFVQNKLYRMAKRGLVESVAKKKGTYALPKDGNRDSNKPESEFTPEEEEKEEAFVPPERITDTPF